MAEIPTKFEFGEYLSHTFPGFFAAVTFFMLLDIWSPKNLTAWAIQNIEGLIGFTAFIVLAGTILGIILDGIRHSLIEDVLFSKFKGLETIDTKLKKLIEAKANGKNEENVDKANNLLTYYYFFNIIGEKPADAQSTIELLIKNVYRYVEFNGNTSISLAMFSFVIPYYLYLVLYIPWNYSFLVAIFSMIIACICLYASYEALKKYHEHRFSLIRGYLDKVDKSGEKKESSKKISVDIKVVE